MSLDREVCLCFHVSRRKVLNFIRIEQPKHASQLSECFGAGTGCGWCRPFLEKILEQSQLSNAISSNEEVSREESMHPPANELTDQNKPTNSTADPQWGELTADAYAAKRAHYIAQGKGKPPGG